MLARRNFFNDFMSDPFDFGFFGTEPAPKANASLMKTDVKETDKAYELDIDLPGFDKENVQIELNDGYLTINASTNEEKEDKDENGTFLRKERFVGSCRRSFYVGDDVSEDDKSGGYAALKRKSPPPFPPRCGALKVPPLWKTRWVYHSGLENL